MKEILHYDVEGTGYPIVLIAGLNSDNTFWHYVSTELKKYFYVIKPDNRGVGKTKIHDSECTTEIMAEDIKDLLESLNIDQAHIIGHSLGGCIAQQFAIKYPHKVNKLILCACMPNISHVGQYRLKATLEMMKHNIPRELLIKEIFCWLFSNNFFSDLSKVNDAISRSLLIPTEKSRNSYFYQAPALFNHNVVNQLSKINADTLIIGGEDDLIIPASSLRSFSSLIKNSKCKIIAETAHMLPLENSDVFCEQVLNFIGNRTYD